MVRASEATSPIEAFSPGIKFGVQLGDTFLDVRLTAYGGWFADGEDADPRLLLGALRQLLEVLARTESDLSGDSGSVTDSDLTELGELPFP